MSNEEAIKLVLSAKDDIVLILIFILASLAFILGIMLSNTIFKKVGVK